MKFKEIWKIITKSFYPGFSCYSCGREMENPDDCLCERCKKEIVKLEGNLCLKCGEPISEPSRYCDECRKNNEDIKFNAARAVYAYDETTARIVSGLKYKSKKYVANFMAREMARLIDVIGDKPDIIIPAPISKKRLRKRGYNQSEILATKLNNIWGNTAEVRTDIVIRAKDVKPQVGLKREDRKHNLDGVFRLAKLPSLEGKIVYIVDDVFTTGTTSNEIARKLKRLKPRAIYVITFAKNLALEDKNIVQMTK